MGKMPMSRSKETEMNCQTNPGFLTPAQRQAITRRQFFADCGVGVGKLALLSLLTGGVGQLMASPTSQPSLADNPLAPKPPHFPAKAKHVIYLFMAGAPSQLDLFDNKPQLLKYDGQPIPESYVKGQRYALDRKSTR